MKKVWGLLPYAAVVVAALLMALAESNLLYTAQEQSLFLHTPLFFRQQMVASGGLLVWAGAYLTQYFYYPALGAVILGLLWALLLWMLRRTMRLPDAWLGVVPVVCLMLTVGTLGYWVYYVKLRGVMFDATLGTLVAVGLLWAYGSLRRRWIRVLLMVLTAVAGYPLFGFYGLWAVALMGFAVWRTAGSHRWADTLLAAVLVAVVPLLCYHYVYHETNIADVYRTALPVFAMHGERYVAYSLPYVFLVLSVTLLLLPLPSWRWLRPSAVAVALVALALFWYADDNFHRELAMRRCIDRQQWQQLLREAGGAKGEPTRAMCLMQNLALFRLGRQGDEARQYPQGSKLPAAPFKTRLVHTVGKALYLEYGLPNYCYRWCMEDGVEYGWTVEKLKLMTLCSLLNGEFVAAQRFLNLLKKTDFQRRWAVARQDYPFRPQLFTNDAALKPILPLLRTDNFLTSDQSQLEHFLIEHFLSTPGVTPEQQQLYNFTMRYYRKNRSAIIEP